MSEKTFKATFDNKEVVKGMEELIGSFKKWLEQAEKTGAGVDKVASRTKAEWKAAIKEQKEFVEGLAKEIKEMEKVAAGTAPGTAQQKAAKEIALANRTLKEETEILQQMQKDSISGNQKEAETQTTIIDKLKKWAIGAASAGTAIKIFKDIVKSTANTAVEFEANIEAAKAGVQFFYKALATGDFNGFINGMKEATRAAYDYVKEMESIENRWNELNIQQSQEEIEIAELREQTYDRDHRNYRERQAALELLITKEEELYTKRQTLREDQLNEEVKLASSMSGLGEDEIKTLLSQYSSLEEVLEKGNLYIQKQKELKGLMMNNQGNVNAAYIVSLQKEIQAMVGGQEAADYAKQVSKVDQETRNRISDLWVQMENERSDYFQKSRTYGTQLGELNAQIALDDARLANQQADAYANLEEGRVEGRIEAERQITEATKTGLDRQLELARLTYEQEILALDKRKRSVIENQNKLSGGIDVQGRKTELYVGELTGEEAEQDLQLRTAAYTKYTATVATLERDAATELMDIQREIAQQFMTEKEKEISIINDKYDEYIKRAKELGATQEELDDMEMSRQKELSTVTEDVATKVTKYWQEAFGDIDKLSITAIKRLFSQTNEVINSAKQETIDGKTYYMVNIPDINEEGEAVTRNVTLTIEEFNKLKDKYSELYKTVRESNPFKALGESWRTLVEAIREGDGEAISNAMKLFGEDVENATDYLVDLTEAFGKFAGTDSQRSIEKIASIISGVGEMAKGITQIAAGNKIGGIISIISGGGSIFQSIMKDWEEASRRMAELLETNFKAAIANITQQISALREKESSLGSVFITDYTEQILNADKAIQAAERELYLAYTGIWNNTHREIASNLSSAWGTGTASIENYIDSLEEMLSDMQIKIGEQNKYFLGFKIGIKDVYASLLGQYPELILENGRLNTSLAETVLETGLLDTASQNSLEAILAFEGQYQEALEQIQEAISAMAGAISDDLYTALTDAWDEGTDSFLAFKNSVTSGMKEIVSQMVFNQVFAGAFQELQNMIGESFGVGGDNSIVDDLASFFEKAPELLELWNQGMADAEAAASAAGLDWASLKETPEALSGGIARSITETTATELAGLMRRIADDNTKNVESNKEAVMNLVNIERNTQRTVEKLDEAVKELRVINENTATVYSKEL